MIRITFKEDKKGYQILHPCDKCGMWQEVFVTKALLEFSEQQFETYEELSAYSEGRPVDVDKVKEEKESLTFVTSLDPKFQAKIAKGIRKVMNKALKEEK